MVRCPRSFPLTAQQERALSLYGQLGTHQAVAEQMSLSLSSVKNHLSDAYRRLGAVSGPQAVQMLLSGERGQHSLTCVCGWSSDDD